MDFRIAEEDRLLQESVRSFIEENANAVWKQIEQTGQLPQSLIADMRELGLFGLSIPPEYGGLGFSVVQKALVHEMMGRGPWGLATFLSVHTGIGCVGIVRFANEEQKRRYLPKMASGEWIGSFALTEPEAGSDAGALATKAERKGDHYLLNGRKIFITNAPKAHHFFLFARTDKGISTFIVDADAPGLAIGQVFDTTGHRGSAVAEVILEDCRVPVEALVGEEGKGFDYAKRCLAEGRTTLAARCVGAAQKAMELALAYGAERRTFGQPLADHQVISFRLAQMSVRTEASRLVVYRSAWMLDQGLAAIRESSTAKFMAAESAWQTVDDALQIFGGNGYIRAEYMIERIWRDLRVARVYDGSSEVQQIVIAHQLRKGDVETPWA
ncbi:MAG TPA: acyl-CoA dehydrogenase family protein [Candidatus Binatia bacterium]|jgi:acyl-CoA dehydrogenase|nr:acyl-CoA dehydrogenase family protein [Candidatus Binatia bacterium]